MKSEKDSTVVDTISQRPQVLVDRPFVCEIDGSGEQFRIAAVDAAGHRAESELLTV